MTPITFFQTSKKALIRGGKCRKFHWIYIFLGGDIRKLSIFALVFCICTISMSYAQPIDGCDIPAPINPGVGYLLFVILMLFVMLMGYVMVAVTMMLLVMEIVIVLEYVLVAVTKTVLVLQIVSVLLALLMIWAASR